MRAENIPLRGQAETLGSKLGPPPCERQRPKPQVRARTTPLWAGDQKPSPQFAPRSHLLSPPSPHKARGVPGGSCLTTVGSSRGGKGHYAIPGTPARINAMPWARAGVAGQAAQAQPCA